MSSQITLTRWLVVDSFGHKSTDTDDTDTDSLSGNDTGEAFDQATELLVSLDELLGMLIDLVASGRIKLGVGLTQRLTGARERISVELATAFDEEDINDLTDDTTNAIR